MVVDKPGGRHLLRGRHGPLAGVRSVRGVLLLRVRRVRRVVRRLHAQVVVLGARVVVGGVVRGHQRPVVRVRLGVVPVGLLRAQGGLRSPCMRPGRLHDDWQPPAESTVLDCTRLWPAHPMRRCAKQPGPLGGTHCAESSGRAGPGDTCTSCPWGGVNGERNTTNNKTW